MGYIHCCGKLHGTRSFMLPPAKGFVMCKLDYLPRCPICGHTVIQLTRVDENNSLSTVRLQNAKAKKFWEKLDSKTLYEQKKYAYNSGSRKFCLYYDEYGVKRQCYSNLSNLKPGRSRII